ncbi:MAG: hypothetical protein A2076_18660 [Geobacteraceae bacterium GWC2_53_11]|nr:MAG: hypothetical protein A2076_18660 [Geobacteraceae bacterium GWC2_53_11]
MRQLFAIVAFGEWNWNEPGKMSNVGVKFCFDEQNEFETDFAMRLRTARGLGFGLDVLSSKEIRIPRNVRKKMTATVVEVMRIRCLVMYIKYH